MADPVCVAPTNQDLTDLLTRVEDVVAEWREEVQLRSRFGYGASPYGLILQVDPTAAVEADLFHAPGHPLVYHTGGYSHAVPT